MKLYKSLSMLAVSLLLISSFNVTFAAKNMKKTPKAVTANTVVATLKGKPIRVKDLELIYQSSPQLQQIPFDKAVPIILQQYIVMKLIAPKTRRFYRKLNKKEKNIFNKTVKNYRATLLTTLYLQKRFGNTKISDKDAREFYNDGLKNGGFKEPSRIEIVDITVKTKSDANKIRKQLQAGKDVQQLIKMKPYSDYIVKDATGNAINNTPKGLIRLDVVQADIQKEAKKMKVGDVSEPISLNGNYVVFKVIQKIPKQTVSFEKAKSAIKARLLQQEVAQKSQEYVQNMLKQAIQPGKGKKPIAVIKLNAPSK